MNPAAAAFSALVAAVTAVELALAARQVRFLARRRAQGPRAADYGAARARLGAVAAVQEAVLALAWTVGGGLDALDRAGRAAGLEGLALGLAVVGAFALLSALLHLPLAAYRTFVVEERFGFNRTTPRLFLADLGRMAALAVVLGGPAAAAALWLVAAAPRTWWLWVWLLWMALNLLLAWIFPVLIAPLFFRHRPLADPTLSEHIRDLLRRCGLRAREVLVADGSRRSAHGNAYFAGLGAARRVVLFDTLLARLGPEEVLAVVAHELGHDRLGHIRRRLALAAAVSLAGLALLGWLASQPWLQSGLGPARPAPHGTLLLIVVAGPWLAAPLTPLVHAVSRRHEREADAYAAAVVGRVPLRRALLTLYEDSAAAQPDPLYSAWHDSHPPPAERLGWLGATLPQDGAAPRAQAPREEARR
ncbi:M48 family metallopeptidase [Inmirania thermothiophila]|uniref:STE24 endopeptidase n=1 Tax=Inmirania thermothiophila TaxID=1750597 RepID=A0A3N1XZJ6_9GAMM|nr:M48 family metallopeptidase [Inmirania thermothiophila]ROR32015.1 STE24 endopeptidase [Inmirania thermothiophila]